LRAELLGDALVLRVRDEPPAQALLDLLGRLLALGEKLRRDRREQRLRLEVDQGRRDDEVLVRDLDVEGCHDGDVVEVLPGDRRERHRRDIALLLAHEVEQQVEADVHEPLLVDVLEVYLPPRPRSDVQAALRPLKAPDHFQVYIFA